MTEGVNRAVRECRERGVLTSATLMANVPAFAGGVEVAAELARETRDPQFSTGCHIVLIDGEPLLPAAQLPTLTRNGRFRTSLASFAVDATRGRIRADEIEQEATAQIQKLQSAGVRVSHIDTHKHAHMLPAVLEGVLRAAARCGVRAIRNPFEANMALAGTVATRPGLWVRFAEVQVLRGFREQFLRKVREYGLGTTDGSLGVTLTGAMDEAFLEAMLCAMPEGTWELVCHPGHNDAELERAGTRLLASRETETQLLTSPQTRELMEELEIELCSY